MPQSPAPAPAATPAPTPSSNAVAPSQQRDALLDAQRKANEAQPRNFKEDALDDKVVTVGPDGTGPTSTESFDPAVDQSMGSGNDTGRDGQARGSQTSDQPDPGKTDAR